MNSDIKIGATAGKIVYVKPVEVAALPAALRDQAGGRDIVFALHDEAGGHMALVADRDMAFDLARAHKMVPMPVH